MREITIDDLKREFDAVIDAIEHGEIIVILRDGVPVVRMEPVRASRPADAP